MPVPKTSRSMRISKGVSLLSELSAAFLILMSCTDSQAQFLRGYGLKLGAVAANQSWNYTGSSSMSYDNRWGFTVSGYVEFLDLPFVSGVLEAQYTQKGISESIPVTDAAHPDGTGEFITYRPRVDYLSIPLMIKVRFPMQVLTPYVVAGPRLDLLVGKDGGAYSSVIDSFKTSDFGATFGAGMEFQSMLPVGVFAEFRYNPSFQDAYDKGALKIRNRSMDFVLGVRF